MTTVSLYTPSYASQYNFARQKMKETLARSHVVLLKGPPAAGKSGLARLLRDCLYETYGRRGVWWIDGDNSWDQCLHVPALQSRESLQNQYQGPFVLLICVDGPYLSKAKPKEYEVLSLCTLELSGDPAALLSPLRTVPIPEKYNGTYQWAPAVEKQPVEKKQKKSKQKETLHDK